MRRFLKGLALLLLLLVLALAILPHFISLDSLKGPMLARIEATTGHKVSMGSLTFSLLPLAMIEVHDVKIGNPAWAGGGELTDIKTLHIGVELLPLLHKEFHFTDLTLEEPVITLIEQGTQANWQMNAAAPTAQQTPPPANTNTSSGIAIPPVSFNRIVIKNGSVIYQDSSAASPLSISAINLSLIAPDPGKKMAFKGDLVINGKKAAIDLALDHPGYGKDSFHSDVDLQISYDKFDMSWKGAILQNGGAPYLTGKVHIAKLDMADFSNTSNAAPAPVKASSPPPASAGRWSDAPMDLSGLNRANVDLTVAIDKLLLRKATFENIEVTLHAANGKAALTTNEVKAYDGTAQIALDAGSTGAADIAVTIANMKAGPLLEDVAGFDKISGTLAANIKLSASGLSERAMISALNGQGDFALKDGVFKGKNLLAMVHNIGSAFGGSSGSDNTAFSECSGSFTAKGGVVSNTDLKFESKDLRATGTGDANLPDWQVNYLVKPLLVVVAASGITVPVRIEGSLDNPHYRPDLQAALNENLKDPAAVKNTVKALRQNLNTDTLKGLLR